MRLYKSHFVLGILLAATKSAYAANEQTAELKEVQALDEISVHASKDEDDFQARKAARSTKLVYGREELDRMNELTVGDYLRRLPGVTFTGPPGTPKDVRLRGMDKGYTQILIDGLPVPGGGKERQIQVDRIPLDLVERVEIIRAPTADMPNEGLMGTINIVLRAAPKSKYGNARIVLGEIQGEKRDAQNRNLSAQYGDSNGTVSYLMNLSVGERGEIKTKDKREQTFNANTGVRSNFIAEFEDERVQSDTIDFSPRINVKLSDQDELIFSPFFSSTDEIKQKDVALFRYTNPLNATGYSANGQRSEVEDKKREIARLRTDWNHQLQNGAKLTFYAVGQTGGEDKEKSTKALNANGSFNSHNIEYTEQNNHEIFAGARWSQPLANHKLGAGVELGRDNRDDKKMTNRLNASGAITSTVAGGRGDTFEITEKRMVAYAQDEIKLTEGHYLTPGLRYQKLNRASKDGLGETINSSIDYLTPSMHYVWNINNANNLRASITKAVKPPKFDDLSPVNTIATGAGAGTLTNPDIMGNPNLKPESAIAYELGFDHFLPKNGGVMGVNLFFRDLKDKIESRTALDGARFVQSPQNVGDANIYGYELDARPSMAFIGLPDLMLRFNYSRFYSSLQDNATGMRTRIKDQPPYVYNIGFDWRLPTWQVTWGMNYNYTPNFLKNPAEVLKPDVEPDQKLLDMYVYKQLNQYFGLRLSATNLLNFTKNKLKSEYSASTGARTKLTNEDEVGGRGIYLALESRF